MKCLSVSQPFADLIILGKKTIELRKWNTNFRGELLIHSPLKIRNSLSNIQFVGGCRLTEDWVNPLINGQFEIVPNVR